MHTNCDRMDPIRCVRSIQPEMQIWEKMINILSHKVNCITVMWLMQISKKCRHSAHLTVLISSCIIKIVRTGDVSNTVFTFPFLYSCCSLYYNGLFFSFIIFLHLTIFSGNGLVVQQGWSVFCCLLSCFHAGSSSPA